MAICDASYGQFIGTREGITAACTDEAPVPLVPASNEWDFTVGLGVAYVPRYPGSRYEYTRVMPVASVLYGRFFFGGRAASSAKVSRVAFPCLISRKGF